MITPNNIKKEEAEHIVQLLEQITRAEIMARLGPRTSFVFGVTKHWSTIQLETEEELLEYVFGTSCLVELGLRWELLKKKE